MFDIPEQRKLEIVTRIQEYFDEELEQEIGTFDAQFLLDFFMREVGPHFYNQAIADIHVVLSQQFENLADLIYDLEKPLPR